MSNTTKGKWKAYVNTLADDPHGAVHAEDGGKSKEVICIGFGDNVEANLTAIAALPELVEAAQWVLQIEDGPWIASEWIAAKNALRAALEKGGAA